MPQSQTITDSRQFQRILTRNVSFPLGLGLVGALLFVVLISYLLGTIHWVEHSDEVLRRANMLQRLTVDKESGMRGYLLSGQESFLVPYETARTRIAAETETLRALVADNPAQVERMRRIDAFQNEWNRYAQDQIGAKRMGGRYEDAVLSGRGKQLMDAMRGEFDDLLAAEQTLRAERNADASRTSWIVIGCYLAFVVGLSAFLAWNGRRELLRLSGTYGAALDEQAQQADSLRAQAWLRDGQRQLAESMAGREDMSVLGREALDFLARYLGIVVGALYARTDYDRLERVAAWGLTDEAQPRGRVFATGESVVAEVANSGRQVVLRDLPPGYLRVTSGVGEGAPQSVIVSPIGNEGAVNGVIEIGFLRASEPRDAQLLEAARDILGASIDAARYRKRLQESLEEQQQLNEELQTQQEELRTANEELEEQSRALRESQAHLESQQAELEQINVRLSEQRDILDSRNEALATAQGDLEQRAKDLERASRYKSEFLANMSHELRTPLNSALILARLLADNGKGNLDGEQVKFAEAIYSAGNDLLDLINDILDIAKVEAGKLEVRPEVVGLTSLTESLRATFQPLAEQRQLAFEVDAAPGLPQTLFTDRQRVEQILKNLLANAVKFTERGSVTLRIAAAENDAIAFEVRDTGIGIAADQQQAIFEAFRQADGTDSRRYGGTGLGLSISRDLARLLGGGITVQSTQGEGSTFTLTIPRQLDTSRPASRPAPLPTAAPTPAPTRAPERRSAPPAIADDRDAPLAPSQRRVLVVEDEPQFAQILRDLAHELGYSCVIAQDAEAAIAYATAQRIDAILLDMRLPDSSGLTVLQRVKDNPATRHVPVHVISVEDLSETALQMGAVGYARKPATREDLRQVFARVEAKLAQKVKRVLVVEDDALQRESIGRLIGDEDIEIVAADTGARALELLRGDVFDCMIIDLKLPDMTGNQVLERMASEEQLQSFPPVIVYTGRNLTREEEAELSRYSRSIIIKGARSPERLLDEVTLFLHKVETELSSDRQRMLRVARNRDKVFEGRRILLVDDDVRNIFALTSALEQKGASVVIGRNGQEALDKLASSETVDLVLMDIMMPGMDGYAAMREIRKNPKWRNLPIIAVTAKAMKDDQERCLAAGANDYLAKPIELERLFSLIRVWMPKVERI